MYSLLDTCILPRYLFILLIFSVGPDIKAVPVSISAVLPLGQNILSLIDILSTFSR